MELSLGENKYSFDHIGLRKWLELEEIRETFIKAADEGSIDNMVLSLCSYLSAALGISSSELLELPWYEVANAFSLIAIACIPKYNFAILSPKQNQDEIQSSWDYEQRTWYLWSHVLASSYGWSLEYIAEIDFNDALALIQEITIDEQLRKEWEWGMSELAYSYDEASKKSKFHPLPRPHWMKENVISKPVQKVKILKSMLPVGIVRKLGRGDEIPTN